MAARAGSIPGTCRDGKPAEDQHGHAPIPPGGPRNWSTAEPDHLLHLDPASSAASLQQVRSSRAGAHLPHALVVIPHRQCHLAATSVAALRHPHGNGSRLPGSRGSRWRPPRGDLQGIGRSRDARDASRDPSTPDGRRATEPTPGRAPSRCAAAPPWCRRQPRRVREPAFPQRVQHGLVGPVERPEPHGITDDVVPNRLVPGAPPVRDATFVEPQVVHQPRRSWWLRTPGHLLRQQVERERHVEALDQVGRR